LSLAGSEVYVEVETPSLAAGDIGPEARTRHGLALCGLILAVLGLGFAIARPYIAEVLLPPPPPEPRPKVSEVLADAGVRFVDRMLEKVRGRAAAPKAEPPLKPRLPERPWLLYLSVFSTSLGLVGALSGAIGWIRREDSRLAGSAIAVGALAVAWVYIVAALVIALVIFFLFLLCSALGWTA
jgi:hypothetical protein